MGVDSERRRVAVVIVAVFCAHTLSALIVSEPATILKVFRRVVKVAERSEVARRNKPRERVHAPVLAARDVDLGPYESLGSWVDLFNSGPWKDPKATVRRMDRRGVRTIYLQTATYGSKTAVAFPERTSTFIDAAHARDINVVAWSVPSFVSERKDFWRARDAIRFRSANGDRFDSFALDIEADIVRSIWKRNRRLMSLSRKIREVAGPAYPLGAITPDPAHNKYWPNFPYDKLGRFYDVIVPMGYFTFRTHGYANVRKYTARNIRFIRRETKDPETPIHVIGGIADDVDVPAARGFVRAVKEHHVLGASLYDFPITSKRTWKELSKVRHVKGDRRDS